MKRLGKINKVFLFWTVALVVMGFFIFSSASLGVLAQDELKFSNVAFKQVFFGLFFGSLACVLFARINYRLWQKASFFLALGSLFLTILVFIPGLGIEHAGAKRWVNLGFISFQPAEFLKVAIIAYFAAWLSGVRDRASSFKWGLLPLIILLVITGIILLAQPDTDTYAVIVFALLAMYLAGGGKWRHVFAIGLAGLAVLAVLAFTRPYIMQRIEIMISPGANLQTTGYQLNQSLIAVGSGGLWGRGFGQSVQKFSYLPEPIGDSVFAVAAEEFGFVGTLTIIMVFLMFALSGLRISSGAADSFGRLFSLGIVILIVSQAFLNIGGMIGVLPLTGIPLPFVSHGGTALFITLVEAGIIMNISRTSKK